MGTNGKQPSKWTEDFLNQQWCSLECVTHQRHSKQWYGQHFWRYDQWLHCDHIHWRYFPLCTRWKGIDRKHQEGSNMLTRQWSIPETDQMRIQPDKGWILRTGNRRRKNLYGPRKAKRNQGLANPYNSQANPRIFRVWELLPTIHLAFIGAGKTTEWSPKERLNIWMDRQLPESIWIIEKAIYWRTCLNDARPKLTIPDWNRCLKICNRGSSHSVRFEWWQTPSLLYLKYIFTSWKELWNLWSWITCNHESVGRIETLHPRISTYNSNPIWSQELDLLLWSQETKSMTSMMVFISFRIWC